MPAVEVVKVVMVGVGVSESGDGGSALLLLLQLVVMAATNGSYNSHSVSGDVSSSGGQIGL